MGVMRRIAAICCSGCLTRLSGQSQAPPRPPRRNSTSNFGRKIYVEKLHAASSALVGTPATSTEHERLDMMRTLAPGRSRLACQVILAEGDQDVEVPAAGPRESGAGRSRIAAGFVASRALHRLLQRHHGYLRSELP